MCLYHVQLLLHCLLCSFYYSLTRQCCVVEQKLQCIYKITPTMANPHLSLSFSPYQWWRVVLTRYEGLKWFLLVAGNNTTQPLLHCCFTKNTTCVSNILHLLSDDNHRNKQMKTHQHYEKCFQCEDKFNRNGCACFFCFVFLFKIHVHVLVLLNNRKIKPLEHASWKIQHCNERGW